LGNHHTIKKNANPYEEEEQRDGLGACREEPFELRVEPQACIREWHESDRHQDEQKECPLKEKYSED